MTGKRLFQCFVFFLLTGLNVDLFAQTEQETQNIATLCKVWGFLKYYHPEVAKGKYDWDAEFMNRVGAVRKLNGKEETSQFYLEWIESLGEVKKCKKCDNNIPDSLKFNLDNEWLKDTNVFSPELAKRLVFIEENRNQGKNKYVAKTRWIGSASMKNEKIYKDSVFPSVELRLLGLSRYWNFTNYYFPYKYQMDIPWSKTLTDMIPLFLYAKDTVDYHKAMLELVVRIDDTHGMFGTNYSFRHFGFKKALFRPAFVENMLIVASLYNDSICSIFDIKIGDIICFINGYTPKDLYLKNAKYIYGSNENRKMQLYSYNILNGDSDSLNIQFERNGIKMDKTIPRYYWNSKYFDWDNMYKDTMKSYIELTPEIGYINMGKLERREVKETMEKASSKKGLIIDVRNYPNIYATVLSPYLNDARVEFVKFTDPDLDYPGVFRYTDHMLCGKKGNKEYYKGKVIVLFNSNTQSAAEFTVMALQTAPDVTCIGSQTSGADGNVTKIIFPGDYSTLFSGIGVYYPDGRETQRIGIVPDIEVKPTIKGIREGRDEVLEKAIEVINQR